MLTLVSTAAAQRGRSGTRRCFLRAMRIDGETREPDQGSGLRWCQRAYPQRGISAATSTDTSWGLGPKLLSKPWLRWGFFSRRGCGSAQLIAVSSPDWPRALWDAHSWGRWRLVSRRPRCECSGLVSSAGVGDFCALPGSLAFVQARVWIWAGVFFLEVPPGADPFLQGCGNPR